MSSGIFAFFVVFFLFWFDFVIFFCFEKGELNIFSNIFTLDKKALPFLGQLEEKQKKNLNKEDDDISPQIQASLIEINDR